MNEIWFDRCKCDICCECIAICPHGVIKLVENTVEVVKFEQCTFCEECVDICPNNVIEVKYDISM